MSAHDSGDASTGHPTVASDYGPRTSAGISWMLYVFMAVSLVIIFWQGSNVVGSAKDAHVWPASDAAKVSLPPYQH